MCLFQRLAITSLAFHPDHPKPLLLLQSRRACAVGQHLARIRALRGGMGRWGEMEGYGVSFARHG